MKSYFVAGLLLLAQSAVWADTAKDNGPSQQKMDNQQLQKLIERVAGNVEGEPGFWQFDLQGFQTTVITDEKADRMRIIVPVAAIADVDNDHLFRIMQANFDSALDARYSIAKEVLWSAFIHPLSALSDHQFVDALAQTVNLAATYGTTYSSGALIFSQGDSQGEQNKYYQEIIERANSI